MIVHPHNVGELREGVENVRSHERMQVWFSRIARSLSNLTGTWQAFLCAILVILIWAAVGPYFRYSDTWQLIINTGTTIVTFIMVFLIQNTQNRDTTAIQLQLSELIRANKKARNELLNLEGLTEEEISSLKASFSALAAREQHNPPRDTSA